MKILFLAAMTTIAASIAVPNPCPPLAFLCP